MRLCQAQAGRSRRTTQHGGTEAPAVPLEGGTRLALLAPLSVGSLASAPHRSGGCLALEPLESFGGWPRATRSCLACRARGARELFRELGGDQCRKEVALALWRHD